MILPLGRWVLSEACRQAAAWSADRPGRSAPDDVGQPLRAAAPGADVRQRPQGHARRDRAHAVAARARDDRDRHVPRHRHDDLAARGHPRSSACGSPSTTSGPGYSSLGYLRRFQVDILKIAREFIGPAESEEEWAFAGAIVALGRTLGLTIIAEGIEEIGQFRRSTSSAASMVRATCSRGRRSRSRSPSC